MLQCLFNALGIQPDNILAVDFKGRNAHDPLGNQNLAGLGILSDVPFDVSNLLF